MELSKPQPTDCAAATGRPGTPGEGGEQRLRAEEGADLAVVSGMPVAFRDLGHFLVIPRHNLKLLAISRVGDRASPPPYPLCPLS
jgi:hypothetical protein